jgi:hypothetical protein
LFVQLLVWPHEDDKHYGPEDLLYVLELLHLRGVYAPGRIHTVSTGVSGKSTLQMQQRALLPCSAPHWSDFRMAFDMGSHTDQIGLKGVCMSCALFSSCQCLAPGIAESCYRDAVAFKPAEAASIYNMLAML